MYVCVFLFNLRMTQLLNSQLHIELHIKHFKALATYTLHSYLEHPWETHTF